jgi:thioredoxin 1
MTKQEEQNNKTNIPGRKDAYWLLAVIIVMAAVLIAQRTYFRGSSQAEEGKIKHLNENTFSKEISTGVVLVDFWATWCKPCVAMEPVLDSIAGIYENRAWICKVDIDKNRELAKENRINVIPTMVIFKDGVETSRFSGIQEISTLAAAIDQALAPAGEINK